MVANSRVSWRKVWRWVLGTLGALVFLGMCAVALLPNVINGGPTDHSSCETNLRKLYEHLLAYRVQRGSWPSEHGSRFWLCLWTEGILEHTAENRDLFFCPGRLANDPYYQSKIRQTPLAELWKDLASTTPADSHYAGPDALVVADLLRLGPSGTVCFAADDNEGEESNHRDGRVNYLLGDGSVRSITLEELQEDGTLGSKDQVIPVGWRSPVEWLRRLNHD